MNGALIPKIVWFIVSFNPGLMSEHLSVSEPMSHAHCVEYAKNNRNSACFSMRPTKPQPYVSLPRWEKP
jgi:hypothetical protein